MRSPALGLTLALVLAAVSPAPAHDITQGDVMVVHPMSRPVTAGRPGAAYMAIVNDGETAERLLGARSPVFEAAELHESYAEDGVAKMRRVEVLEIPADDTALLEPGGLHLMLFGAKRAIAAGDEFPLVLIFENAGEIEVPVMVDVIPAGDSPEPDPGHGQHAAPTQ